MRKIEFWNSLSSYMLNNGMVNFKNLYFSIFWNSDVKIVFFKQKVSGKYAPYAIFWTKHPRYAKSDDFARVCEIINHDLFWCQKLPKTNSQMTLRLIFNHFFEKSHFGTFSVFHIKYFVILGDKKSKLKNGASQNNFDHRS